MTGPFSHLDIAKGARVFNEGDRCRGFPIVVSGEISVRRHYASGRAMELYRIGPGDSCLLSISALTGDSDSYPAFAIATADSRIQVLSRQQFDQRLAQDHAFRQQVLADFSSRLLHLVGLVEDLIEQRVDQRLAALLLRLGPTVCATQAEIAGELGTVREIVARILARFRRKRWIVARRGRIDVIDGEALRALQRGRQCAMDPET